MVAVTIFIPLLKFVLQLVAAASGLFIPLFALLLKILLSIIRIVKNCFGSPRKAVT